MKEKNILNSVNVSRETIEKLNQYKALLAKWNTKINLIAKSDLETIEEAHIEGALKLASLIEENHKSARTICDVGSGSGLPLIVLASFLKDKMLYSIESQRKKVHFLEYVAINIGADITFFNKRIEDINNFKADVITAKAFADIEGFLSLTQNIRHSESVLYTFKGKKIDDELEKAFAKWKFNYKIYNEDENNNKIIVKLSNIDGR
jgi:16S rRNA (guanine527-N7)-methyltransferase